MTSKNLPRNFQILVQGSQGLRKDVLGRGWSYADPTVSLLHDLLDPADRVHIVHGDARRVKGHQRAAICTLLCKMTGRPVTRAVSSLPTLASNWLWSIDVSAFSLAVVSGVHELLMQNVQF